MGFLDKLKDLASKNKGAVDTAIEKAGDVVDQKTQGKYAQQVDKVQDAATELTYGQTVGLRRRSAAAGDRMGMRI
jgi:hypothetical protein